MCSVLAIRLPFLTERYPHTIIPPHLPTPPPSLLSEMHEEKKRAFCKISDSDQLSMDNRDCWIFRRRIFRWCWLVNYAWIPKPVGCRYDFTRIWYLPVPMWSTGPPPIRPPFPSKPTSLIPSAFLDICNPVPIHSFYSFLTEKCPPSYGASFVIQIPKERGFMHDKRSRLAFGSTSFLFHCIVHHFINTAIFTHLAYFQTPTHTPKQNDHAPG